MSGGLSAVNVRARVIDPETEALNDVVDRMREHLSPEQTRLLCSVLEDVFHPTDHTETNEGYAAQFLEAKQLEGKSPRTIDYYRFELAGFNAWCTKTFLRVTANDIRGYLMAKQGECSAVTLDNKRRVLSTFFQWMEDEGYITKSPVKRVHSIKGEKSEKQPFSDDDLEKMRMVIKRPRDRAIFELLLSSGMRVGELVRLDISDMDMVKRECMVLGKGNKRRKCYFNSITELWLNIYLESRKDSNPALFVSLQGTEPKRASIGCVETMVRKIGAAAGVEKAHPHRFRRTFATNAIRRRVPIEQVSKMLGHEKIDTTMIYAIVNEEDVRHSAMRLLG